MNPRALGIAAAACVAALLCTAISGNAMAANGPPLASVWNIAPTGSAASSGELVFRVTPGDGGDPIEVTVPVIMGAKQETVARSIRNSLNSQLPQQDFNVELGAGTNVLVSDPRGQPNFSLELLDSDVEDLRVAVQSVTPAAAPTAPPQTLPAPPPPAVTPPPASAPGDAVPPPTSSPSPGTTTPVPNQDLPPPGTTTPAPNPAVPTPQQSPQSPASAPSGAPASAPPGR